MKKLIIGAMMVAAAMFTACGDDSSSGGSSSLGSCDVHMSMGDLFSTHQCAESADVSMIKAECDSAKAEAEAMKAAATETPDEDLGDLGDLGALLAGAIEMDVKSGSGCPSGYKKKCDVPEKNATHYFYDEGDDAKTCEELQADDDDDFDF